MPGPQELLVIAVVALLVFGPDRLPELARQAGQLLGRLRSETQRNVEELKRLGEIQQLQADLKGLKRELNDARNDVTRGVREVAGLAEDATRGTSSTPDRAASRPRVERTRASVPVRADDDPPPFDPEAT